MHQPDDILHYWFGGLDDAQAIADAQAPLWWGKQDETDALIRERYGDAVRAAAAGELDAWQANPRGRMALIVLTDQFPRNIHRDSSKAFAHDPLARRLCLDGLALQHDQALRPIERVFFYLPLEHSEQIDDQAHCLDLMRELAAEVPAAHKALFDGYVDFALRHKVIIDRFGRFPHRNAVLGRQSTAEEEAFLQQPGSGF